MVDWTPAVGPAERPRAWAAYVRILSSSLPSHETWASSLTLLCRMGTVVGPPHRVVLWMKRVLCLVHCGCPPDVSCHPLRVVVTRPPLMH